VFQADVGGDSVADADALSRVLKWLTNLPAKDREFLFKHFIVKDKVKSETNRGSGRVLANAAVNISHMFCRLNKLRNSRNGERPSS